MVLHTQSSEKFNRFLSDPEKKALGIDMSSFMKRMQARLNRIRGCEDNSTETFLMRHNYQASSRNLA